MNQQKRLEYLLQYLIDEDPSYQQIEIPKDEEDKKQLLRGLMNVRRPKTISDEFLNIQDEYLQEELQNKGIVSLDMLKEKEQREGIYLWQGDITRLKVDGIVNAANSALLGCFIPCHKCIDNAIHTFSGVQLRNQCHKIMERQRVSEKTGQSKITGAYNLPSRYILHTVGPIIQGKVTKKDKDLLQSCYTSCLTLAGEYGVKSIAFCCISTGEFHFPNEMAAEIAVNTVLDFQKKYGKELKVVFNVFKDLDYEIYRRILEQHR